METGLGVLPAGEASDKKELLSSPLRYLLMEHKHTRRSRCRL